MLKEYLVPLALLTLALFIVITLILNDNGISFKSSVKNVQSEMTKEINLGIHLNK